MAGKIDNGKQKIANLAGGAAFVVSVELGFNLVGFFADLGKNGSWIIPIEADRPALFWSLRARVNAGRASGTPANAPLGA